MPEFRRDHNTGRFNRRDSSRDVGRGRSGSGSFGSRDSGEHSGGFRGRDSPRSGGFGERRSFGSRDSSPREGGFGNRGGFGSRDSGSFERREPKFFGKRTTNKKDLFKVICSKCGIECEVPFKPTNNKPVFCSECFKKTDGYESRDFEKKKAAQSEQIDYSEQFNELSQKFDELSERFDDFDKKITKVMNLLGINEK
jgi:CxxC-x17-CxxC domain-containing protein